MAIVNAANSALVGGGGVDGAIHRAAGPQLLDACQRLRQELPGRMLRPGGAIITPGFNLRARYVIHCVGPIYAEAKGDAPRLLAECYKHAISLCLAHSLDSVAFPSISTGVYGYPIHEAAPIALGAVSDALHATQFPLSIRFVLFDSQTYDAYDRAVRKHSGFKT